MILKHLMLTASLLVLGSIQMWAGTVCPAGNGPLPFPHNPDNGSTGCNVVVTINANGSVSVSLKDATPYEESEDILVGVVNNSGSAVTSLNFSGTGIFGFEGDGICTFTFVGSGYCSLSQIAGTDPQDYQGPTSTFSNIAGGGNSGTVNFSPGIAANGGTTYFSLEGLPSSALSASVGSTGTPSVPALSPWAMVALTILMFGLAWRLLRTAHA